MRKSFQLTARRQSPAGGKIASRSGVALHVIPGSISELGAVLKSSARRRLTVALLGMLAIGILPALSAPAHAHVATVPVAGAPWLNQFNAWRASAGVPQLSENLAWGNGDTNHATYMVKNQLITHYETVGYPYYTTSGDVAGRNSNIYISSSTSTLNTDAINWWMQAPFHSMAMMDPRLTTTGFGVYRDTTSGYWQMAAALDVLQGNPFSGGAYPVYFPGNGSTEPLATYGGGESPDPLQGPCAGYTAPTGLPVFIEVGGNVATTAGPVHTIVGNGVSLENCVLDSNTPGVSSNLTSRGGVVLIPRQPLQNGVTYVVTLTVNNLPYTWRFTVGAGPTPGGPPPPPAPLPFKGLYTLDGYGGLHGADSAQVSYTGYWPGWKIARTAKPWPSATSAQSGFVLDGWGGLHPFGSGGPSETSASGHYWPGWDIARDFAWLPDGTGGVVLDGWGGLHAVYVNGRTAPISIQQKAYWPGWDIARKVVIFSDGTGGLVMDGWGGLHPFGINGPPPIAESSLVLDGYWVNWEIARDVVLVPGNGKHSGYTLDGWGGLHPFHSTSDGSTMPAQIRTQYWPGWDIARGVWLLPGSGTAGYTLDGWGGLQPFGGAPPIRSFQYWPGWDIARGIFGA